MIGENTMSESKETGGKNPEIPSTKMLDHNDILEELEQKELSSLDCWYYMHCQRYTEDEIKQLNDPLRPNVDDLEGYSPNILYFAININFYTPRGYDYARETMKLNLPNPRLIRGSLVTTNGEPGYSQEMLDIIKAKALTTKPFCALSMTTMGVDCSEKLDWGCGVDFGASEQCELDSKEVLIYMVTFLDETLYVPVGYFCVSELDEFQLLNLTVGCLELLHDAGAKVVSLTTDFDETLFSVTKMLGCSIDVNETITFEHPVTKEPIALFLDPCWSVYNIKQALQWNAFKVSDTDSHPISWHYVSMFVELLKEDQDGELHEALNKAHINLRGKKKGQVACCTMSNVLVDAARVLSQNILKGEEAAPTIKFIEAINKAYDILSSRPLSTTKDNTQNNYKAPMSPQNITTIQDVFLDVQKTLRSLKDRNGKPLLQSAEPGGSNNKDYMGLLVCMRSALILFDKLVLKIHINALQLHKISLEQICLLTNNIRAKYDVEYYNPPKSRYVKHYFNTMVKEINSVPPEQRIKVLKKAAMLQNYSAVQTINLTYCRASLFDFINITVEATVTKEQNDTFGHIYTARDASWDHINPIQTYIAGFVVSFLTQMIHCDTCNGALITGEHENSNEMLMFHDAYGCVYPSKDVVKVCVSAEKQIQDALKTSESHTDKIKAKSLSKPVIVVKTLNNLVSTDIFDSLVHHQFDQNPTENHLVHLIRAIAEVYVDIRYRHLPGIRKLTQHKDSYFKIKKSRKRRTYHRGMSFSELLLEPFLDPYISF